MFGGSCTGCIQVPTPVYYWGPYTFPTTFGKKSFHITDLIHASQEYQKQLRPGVGLNGNGIHPAEQGHVRTNKPSIIGQYHSGKSSDDSGHGLGRRADTLTFGVRSRSAERDSDPTEAINYSTKIDRTVTCSVPSALEPLQALCKSELRGYEEPGSAGVRKRSASSNEQSPVLKFGMNRILSEDFGKDDDRKSIKESTKMSEVRRPCECTFDGCRIYQNIRFPSHALTAVHALQPPKYPSAPPGSDTLPGPYSVLNTEVNIGSQSKRKRSWSRAVFSNLQRKGLEKRFEVQKYVTKPDRRQLAAMLGLTDAQVKVWFQNRRMKWRHAQQCTTADSETDSPEMLQNGATGNDVIDEPEVTESDFISTNLDDESDSMDEMEEDMNVVVVTEDEPLEHDFCHSDTI